MNRLGIFRLSFVAVFGLSAPSMTAACELDGMSHGYGPMSALFAGAHRYQSLNGMDDEPPPTASEDLVPPAEPAASSAVADEPSSNAGSPDRIAAAVTQRRSFASWAKARPKTPDAEEAPASWVKPVPQGSTNTSGAAPEGAEPDQRE